MVYNDLHTMKVIRAEYPMYYGAKPHLFKLAKDLRKNETEAEKKLWTIINKNQILGLQFRRQHPLNIFIADFFCPKIKLVIEVDGSIHDLPEYHNYDIGRTDVLSDFDITVIRFRNEEILKNIELVSKQILETAKRLLNP